MNAGWWSDWRDEWQRNPRLRLGALLAVAIGGLWALLWAADLRDERIAERDRLAAQVARLRTASQDTRWEPLRDDLRVIDGQWRGQLWRAATEGRMQAALQDWLRQQAAEAGVNPREISAAVMPRADSAATTAGGPVAPGPMLPDGLRIVRGRVVADLSPLQLHLWLTRLTQPPGLTRLGRVAVVSADRRSVEVEVEALFALGEPEPRR